MKLEMKMKHLMLSNLNELEIVLKIFFSFIFFKSGIVHFSKSSWTVTEYFFVCSIKFCLEICYDLFFWKDLSGFQEVSMSKKWRFSPWQKPSIWTFFCSAMINECFKRKKPECMSSLTLFDDFGHRFLSNQSFIKYKRMRLRDPKLDV